MWMLPVIEGMSYRERSGRLRMYSLERTRLRDDMIEVYNVMSGIDTLKAQSVLPKGGESRTRGQRFKVKI